MPRSVTPDTRVLFFTHNVFQVLHQSWTAPDRGDHSCMFVTIALNALTAAYISVMAVCGQTTVSADRTHPSEGAKTNMSILRGLHLLSSWIRWLSRCHAHATCIPVRSVHTWWFSSPRWPFASSGNGHWRLHPLIGAFLSLILIYRLNC